MSAETVEVLFQPEMMLPAQEMRRLPMRFCPEVRLVAARRGNGGNTLVLPPSRAGAARSPSEGRG